MSHKDSGGNDTHMSKFKPENQWLTAGKQEVDDKLFLTVPGLNFDMCTISTQD